MSPYAIEFTTLMAVFSVGIVSPGAELATVMHQSPTHGRQAAIWTGFGIGSALLFHVGYTTLGIGLIVSPLIIAFKSGYGLVMTSALVLWFVGVSCFLTIPSIRDRFLRAGRWIGRVTRVVLIGLGLKPATEKTHG